MLRKLPLLPMLLLSACASGAEADLQYIKEARSTAAEWALVNEQAGQGKLTAVYVSSMHEALREQLQASASALSEPQSGYGREIRALLNEPEDATPRRLRAHSDRLKRIEDELESA
jgi:Tfp pilus assembly protein PilP